MMILRTSLLTLYTIFMACVAVYIANDMRKEWVYYHEDVIVGKTYFDAPSDPWGDTTFVTPIDFKDGYVRYTYDFNPKCPWTASQRSFNSRFDPLP